MSDQTDNTERRIIEAESSSLLIRDEREKSPIISEIVTSALTIAQGSEILLNDAESIFQKAKKLYNSAGSKQNASRREAFALFQEASLKDHAEARYFIGCFYNYGIIVNSNPAEAVFHYMGASELNHTLALDILGLSGLGIWSQCEG
jgi:TPR repeat protein